jgi:hypothetical protein
MKKTNLLKTINVLGLCLVFSACTKDHTYTNDVVHEKNVVTADQSMDADALTAAGEQLMSPYTFMLADKAFDMALAKDPNQTKALFLKTYNKRLMTLRGILNRVHPYAKNYGNVTALDDTIDKLPNSPLKDFLLDGGQDIANARDVQEYLAVYRDAADEFRRYAKKNNNMELTLNLNPSGYSGVVQSNYMSSCRVVDNGAKDQEGTSFKVECDSKDMLQAKVNAADIQILQQEIAGEIFYLSLYTGWGLNGIDQLSKNYDKAGAARTQRETFETLKATPGFGELLSNNKLSLIPELGADFSAAAKWALQYQQQLCPTGSEGSYKQNRPGFLFSKGICNHETADQAQREIALLDAMISGVTHRDLVDHNGNIQHDITLNALALVRNPVANLTTLLPSQYDENGFAIALQDKTFGGTYPDGNAEAFLLSPGYKFGNGIDGSSSSSNSSQSPLSVASPK